MNHYVTPDVVVYLEVLGSGVPRILLDTVCGIMYEAQGGKIPVFSHRSIEFDAIAEGRSMVSGLLIVNKGYKDMIAGVVKFMSENTAENTATNTATSRNNLDIARTSQSYTDRVKDHIDTLKNIINSNTVNNQQIVPIINKWNIIALNNLYVDLNGLYNEVKNNPLGSKHINVVGTYLNQLNDLIIPTAIEANTNIDAYVANNGNTITAASLANDSNRDLITFTNRLITHIEAQIQIINSADLDLTIESQKDIATQSDNLVINIPKIYGSDLFNSLRLKGHHIQLILQFGRPDDAAGGNHEVVINDVYFASESVNISTDNRDNIKDGYSFIGRSVK